MVQISINNGMSFVKPGNAIDELAEKNGWKKEEAWEVITGFMDDEIVRSLDFMTPCGELEFLEAYLKDAKEDLIIG